MARTKEQALCKMTSAKAGNMLWLKYMTDVIATFGVGFLAGAAHMTDEEWGKILMIATAMSWFIWFLILYLHRNLRKTGYGKSAGR